jgi:chromosome segregation ATPase
VTQQYADLRDRPAQSAQASDEDVTSNVLAIRQAEDHAATLQADITRLTTELASERRAMESLRRLIDDKDAQLSTLTNKQERYRADFDFLRSHISRTDIALEATENELEEHRDKRAEAEDALESTKRTLAMSTRRLSQLEKRAGALVRARDTQIALAESRAEELRTLGTEERKLRNDLLVSERAQRTLVRARDAQRDRADALQESLTRREDEIHTLSESIDLQKSQETETRSELKRTRSQLGELRRSRTYRAGMAWRDATTWYGFWALVPRLIKIAMERSH